MTWKDCLNVSIPLIALAVNVISQILHYRIRPQSGLLKSIFWGFIAGLSALSLLEITGEKTALKDVAGNFLADFIAYSALGYCYFHFINLGETARRTRILRELKESAGGLTLNEILSRYNAKEIIERRISRLIQTGQVKLDNNKLFIGKPLVLIMARFLIFLKIILLGKKSEFE